MMNTWNLIELQSAWNREKKNFILILDQIKVYWCADTCRFIKGCNSHWYRIFVPARNLAPGSNLCIKQTINGVKDIGCIRGQNANMASREPLKKKVSRHVKHIMKTRNYSYKQEWNRSGTSYHRYTPPNAHNHVHQSKNTTDVGSIRFCVFAVFTPSPYPSSAYFMRFVPIRDQSFLYITNAANWNLYSLLA